MSPEPLMKDFGLVVVKNYEIKNLDVINDNIFGFFRLFQIESKEKYRGIKGSVRGSCQVLPKLHGNSAITLEKKYSVNQKFDMKQGFY